MTSKFLCTKFEMKFEFSDSTMQVLIKQLLSLPLESERKKRLKAVNDSLKLFRCHSIMNCSYSCPKGLNPAKEIAGLKKAIVTEL